MGTTIRTVEQHRLTWFHAHAPASYWEDLWDQHLNPETYRNAEQGDLGEFEEVFTRFLPRSGPILEAGCGVGTFVLALRQRHYEAEGVDNAVRTIEQALRLRPDLPLRVGDVGNLAVPDDHYAGYFSNGVVEHFRAGPEKILLEAWRVLRPGGVAIITVPYFNPLRRLKARLGRFRNDPTGLEFYQYAFGAPEFLTILAGVGFTILQTDHFGLQKGLRDEWPFLGRIQHLPWIGPALGWRIQSCLRRCQKPLSRCCAHMLRVVVRKPEAGSRPSR
ncbi:MAG: methyltransferase domain-containing protein [Magnetococcales bacterium]|nr:methyltransferase domain-containing protein [Magnetococcales bacterium]